MININNEFELGERVFDDLTAKEATVIGISWARGKTRNNRTVDQWDNLGYWLDSDYLGGGRHPWELSKLKCCGSCIEGDGGVCQYAGEISTNYLCDKYQRRTK